MDIFALVEKIDLSAAPALSARINSWVNNGEAGDLRRHRAHYDVNVMHNYLIRLITSDVN